jgi:membrane protease subunit HflK
MAWNQPGEDNKKRPPARGSPDDSSLDDMLRRWQRRVQRLWRPGSGRGTAMLVLVAVVVTVWLASGYYQVDMNDRGVVQRFGRLVAIDQPGHGWHWPWPIETMKKVNVALSVNGADYKALMLTSDQSLIDISWSVQYQVSDPVHYLFSVSDEPTTLRETSETVFRELVAQYDLPGLLTGEARARLASDARGRIQRALDIYQAGVVVTGINLTDVQLPDAVLASQRDTAKAEEERRRAIEDAQGYASDIVPKAQTAATRQLADAQVYASQTVANAEGEAERFSDLANAYTQAPEATRSRIYIETMESILSRSRKIVIDAKTSGGNVLYLPLDKITEAVRATAPSAASASTATSAPAQAPAPTAAAVANGTDRGDGDDRGRERADR